MPSVADSCSAVWSFIQRRLGLSTARTLARRGNFFVSFLPAMSAKAAKRVRQTIREWRMASTRNNQRLEDLARLVNPAVRGWMNYYGHFYRSKCVQVLRQLNEALARWARRKYKR